MFKYCKAYAGFDPVISDGDIFKLTLKHDLFNSEQVGDKPRDQVRDQARDQVRDQVDIVAYCETPKTLNEIMLYFGYKSKTKFRNKFLNPLIEKGLIVLTNPDSPNSPNQKYVATK